MIPGISFLHFLFQLCGNIAAGAMFLMFEVPGNALLRGSILWHGMGLMPFFIYFTHMVKVRWRLLDTRCRMLDTRCSMLDADIKDIINISIIIKIIAGPVIFLPFLRLTIHETGLATGIYGAYTAA